MNTTISAGPAPATLPPVRQNVVLAVCCMSLLLVSMDATIVNVALPDIRRDLRASLSGLQWVLDAYTIVMASFLILGGSTADRYGRRRVFQVGIAVFMLGSLACSLAVGEGTLVAGRVVQALGASMMNPVAMSIIVHTFVEPKARARAIGVWAGVAGLAMALGPLAGGVLTQTLGWHSIFWINVPICLLALGLTAQYVPESRAPKARRPDPVGQALLLIGLASLVFAVIESGRGWIAIAAAASAVLAFTALILYEKRRHEPMLDLRFFHSVPFSAATIIVVCMFAAIGGFLLLNSLYLQDVRGLSALHAGMAILPMAVAVTVVSPLSGRLVATHGARPSLLVSGTMLAVSAAMLAQLEANTPLVELLTAYALFGVGFGMVNAPVTFAAVSGMPRAQAGIASAVASTSRQVGVAVGVALAGTLAGSPVGDGDAPARFVQASHSFWWILAGLGILVAVLAIASTGPRARASTARIAHLLREPDLAAAAA
ncbi:MAG: MFS transporter [Casimicrobiaceae bacterium]